QQPLSPSPRAGCSSRSARWGLLDLSFADVDKKRTTRMPVNAIRTAALLSCCLLTWTASTDAAIIATTTLIEDPSAGMPFAPPDAALGAPWVSYLLTISATAGEQIEAVDVHIHGQLHQRWTDVNGAANFQRTANSTNTNDADSHLLAPSKSIFAYGPS